MKWTEVDGKPALMFEEMPSFVFVSQDGTYNLSELYLDGECDRNFSDIEIRGEFGGVITYNVTKYALSKNDDIFK